MFFCETDQLRWISGMRVRARHPPAKFQIPSCSRALKSFPHRLQTATGTMRTTRDVRRLSRRKLIPQLANMVVSFSATIDTGDDVFGCSYNGRRQREWDFWMLPVDRGLLRRFQYQSARSDESNFGDNNDSAYLLTPATDND